MGLWIAIAVMGILAGWLFLPRRRAVPEPEDDVTTPIDREELEAAERELKEDRGAGSLGDRADPDDDYDDWGPGAR